MKLIATSFKEVAKKPIDFFSIGHIIFGYVSFLVVYGFLSYLKFPQDSRTWSFLVGITCGLLWEITENVLLRKIKDSIWGKDSLENSLADQVFVFIGSGVAYGVSSIGMSFLLTFGFAFVVLLTMGMYIAIKYTQKPKKKK